MSVVTKLDLICESREKLSDDIVEYGIKGKYILKHSLGATVKSDIKSTVSSLGNLVVYDNDCFSMYNSKLEFLGSHNDLFILLAEMVIKYNFNEAEQRELSFGEITCRLITTHIEGLKWFRYKIKMSRTKDALNYCYFVYDRLKMKYMDGLIVGRRVCHLYNLFGLTGMLFECEVDGRKQLILIKIGANNERLVFDLSHELYIDTSLLGGVTIHMDGGKSVNIKSVDSYRYALKVLREIENKTREIKV